MTARQKAMLVAEQAKQYTEKLRQDSLRIEAEAKKAARAAKSAKKKQN